MKTKCQKEVEVLSKQESYVSLHYIYKAFVFLFRASCQVKGLNVLSFSFQHIETTKSTRCDSSPDSYICCKFFHKREISLL